MRETFWTARVSIAYPEMSKTDQTLHSAMDDTEWCATGLFPAAIYVPKMGAGMLRSRLRAVFPLRLLERMRCFPKG
jgi:hypothetical protein